MKDSQGTKTQTEQPQPTADEDASRPFPENSDGEHKSECAGPSAFDDLLRDEEFFRTECQRLARQAKRLQLQPVDLEDVIQEAWLCALENRELFVAGQIEPRLHGWMKTLTFRRAVDLIRRRSCHPCQSLAEQAIEPSDEAAAKSAVTAELHEWLDALLEKVSHSSDVNLHLLRAHYFLGLTIAELAQQFSMTEKAVEGRLGRMRKNMPELPE